MRIVVLGIDLGKNLCSLAGLDETGAVVLRRRMKRASVLPFTAQLEACTVAMEACCGAHSHLVCDPWLSRLGRAGPASIQNSRSSIVVCSARQE
jgi:proteasome lid subunit RPN8/RPN11